MGLFGKQGQAVLCHPNPHVIKFLQPQKMNVLPSSGNLRRPKLNTIIRLYTGGAALHYQQIATFRSVVYAVEYAVDALFIHCLEPAPSLKMR